MPTKKKRILICNDAHFLFTGYGKYGREVLSRLYNTGKYEIAELASYGQVNDKNDNLYMPWRYYANSVKHTHPEIKEYESNEANQFGRWRFERTCLDFEPDIVMDIRDPWAMSFEHSSPLRPFYHWAIMPTVDSAPQQEDWLEMFSCADGVFTYSDYGQKVLEKEGGGTIPLVGTAPPGVDLEVFRPLKNKEVHRKNMGFSSNCNIIGTIMRNQARKLYPDLFQAFRMFLDKCVERGKKDIANKTFLYAHCTYPDMGWEIPGLLKEHGLGHKVIFSYICKNCENAFCCFFRDARTVCPACNHVTAMLPNPNMGLKPVQLSQVLNTFDIYIQYAVCEGFGMPQAEAAACGIPLMSVNYSAMEDLIKKTKGTPIKVEKMFRDIGTGSYRALPDNDSCAEEMYKFFAKPIAMRRRDGMKARRAAEQYYNWDHTAKIWEHYIDSVQLKGLQGKWDAPMLPCSNPSPDMPDLSGLTNSQFIDWLICNVMMEPERLNTRFAMKQLRELNYQVKQAGNKTISVSRKSMYSKICQYAANKLECEKARTKQLEMRPADFIKNAHDREKYLK